MRIKWFSLIRIAGLCSVLTYHFFANMYLGGFIGVDIFFTFSGFLITALMIDEFSKTNGFGLIAFYRRRFYRIVPPLIMSILIVTPLTYLVNPDYIVGLGKQIAAAAGFVTNYFEIATGGSYESKFIPHLFVHTWSLAVEMHFYIIWGLLAAICAHVISRRGYFTAKATQVFRKCIGILSFIVAVTSATLMALNSAGLTDFSKVYFSSVTHSFPFFIGAILASLTGIKTTTYGYERISRSANRIVTILFLVVDLGILFYLGRALQFSLRSTYIWGILVASLCSTIGIFLTRILHDVTPNVDEPKWITFIADTSYSMYLYHWPLFVIFSKLMSVPYAALLTVVIGLPLSATSYYVIEPLIAGKRPNFMGTRFLTGIKVCIALIAVELIGIAGYTVHIAPKLTSLEQRLWISGLYQSADQIKTSKDVILAAVKNGGSNIGAIPKGVSIVGDSVTLGTRSYLSQHVSDSTVDAAGERTMDLAYNVVMTAQKNNVLRKNVVICIGTNALDGTQDQLDKLISDLAPGHRLILMTPYDQRADPSWNSSKLADYERTLPAKHKFITIADWQREAAKHPDVFAGTDGVHFGGRHSGDVIYAQTVNDALVRAKNTPVK